MILEKLKDLRIEKVSTRTSDSATQAQIIMYSKLFKINFTKMDPYEFKSYTDILQRYSDLCKPAKENRRGKKKKYRQLFTQLAA